MTFTTRGSTGLTVDLAAIAIMQIGSTSTFTGVTSNGSATVGITAATNNIKNLATKVNTIIVGMRKLGLVQN